MDLNRKAPMIDPSDDWVREVTSSHHRSSERQRVRRRVRTAPANSARVRFRIMLACAGALLVIAAGLYWVLGHEPASPQGTILAQAVATRRV